MRMKKIVTCEQKHEFWKEQELTVYEQPGEMQVVSIYPQVTYQTIDGFGGAFTEASAHTYMGCSDAKKKEMIEAYFGKDGLRYTARTSKPPGKATPASRHGSAYPTPIRKSSTSCARCPAPRRNGRKSR